MAGKVKAVKGSVRKKGFSVSGKNLKEIWDDLIPHSPGKALISLS